MFYYYIVLFFTHSSVLYDDIICSEAATLVINSVVSTVYLKKTLLNFYPASFKCSLQFLLCNNWKQPLCFFTVNGERKHICYREKSADSSCCSLWAMCFTEIGVVRNILGVMSDSAIWVIICEPLLVCQKILCTQIM